MSLRTSDGRIEGETSGYPLLITITPATATLIPVVDRGNAYKHPTEHQGIHLENTSPLASLMGATEIPLRLSYPVMCIFNGLSLGLLPVGRLQQTNDSSVASPRGYRISSCSISFGQICK